MDVDFIVAIFRRGNRCVICVYEDWIRGKPRIGAVWFDDMSQPGSLRFDEIERSYAVISRITSIPKDSNYGDTVHF
jgi:hypothetical protein